MTVYTCKTRILFISTLFMFTMSLTGAVLGQDKPLLSDAIRDAIENQGVEAAKAHFAEMDADERARYNIDTEGISELTNAYLEDGNMDALMAVSEISAPFMQDMISQAMEQYSSPEMMQKMTEQRQAEREDRAQEREKQRAEERRQNVIERQGEPRDDLQRFTGLYGDPNSDESHRQLWVQVSCDGYLVSGAMWGDASPWWLRSESENVFTYEDSFNDLRMSFQTGSDGSLEMVHNLEFMESPLIRTGPLPDDWNSCLERYP